MNLLLTISTMTASNPKKILPLLHVPHHLNVFICHSVLCESKNLEVGRDFVSS